MTQFPMKIGLLLHPYGERKPAGLGAFVLNLTRELIRQNPGWHFYIFIKGAHDTSPFNGCDNVTIQLMPDSVFWKDIAYVKHRDIDVWLYHNPNLPFFVTPKRSVVTALDLGVFYPKEEPTLRSRLYLLGMKLSQHSSLKRATHIACTSFATKQDVHRFFPDIKDEKVSVVMCGYTRVCEVYAPDRTLSVPDTYYLLVGVIKARKNQLTAVRAFVSAKERGLKGKLVICGKGKGPYFESLMKEISKAKCRDEIIYLGYRTNEELVMLYQHARALVFPSHVEGFGMPILEAMSCGTPVITSSNNGLGEAAGDAALTVDSSDTEGFAQAMLRLENEELRNELVTRGYRRAGEFSWERSAREYATLLQSVAS